MKRRDFLTSVAGAAGLATVPLSSGCNGEGGSAPAGPPNFLMIVVDDLGYSSVGANGCPLPGVTPNMDRLAAEGMRFAQGHATVASCQPSRTVFMTGRYPLRNGATGFTPVNHDVPTLTETLKANGYVNGIMGKVKHLDPQEKFGWDFVAHGRGDLAYGRNPAFYYKQSMKFFREVAAAGKPFFLMANSHDPHRPFVHTGGEKELQEEIKDVLPIPDKEFDPDEVPVPGFLPDLPRIRRDVAAYFRSVYRADQTVGEVLKALDRAGLRQSTFVILLSDHGMDFPFAKANCYLAATRIPWIIRWPGVVEAGVAEEEHMVSGIDLMPTLLDVAGVEQVEGMDGRSFLPVLHRQTQSGRDHIFTVYHTTFYEGDYPMRCVRFKDSGYIFNAWSDGENEYNRGMKPRTSLKAMQEAARDHPDIARRLQFLSYRAPEEFYDLAKDPYALENRVDDPNYAAAVNRMRRLLAEYLTSMDDPLAEAFRKQVGLI